MLTNYKINQPFKSNFSVEKGEKNSSRIGEIMEPAELSTLLKPFYAEAREVSGRKTTQWQHCESQYFISFRAGQIFFLVPFKESRYSG